MEAAGNPLLPGEGGRDSQRADAPGEGSNAKPFVTRALTRAPFFEASPYRARASRALCPLPVGEGLGAPTPDFPPQACSDSDFDETLRTAATAVAFLPLSR